MRRNLSINLTFIRTILALALIAGFGQCPISDVTCVAGGISISEGGQRHESGTRTNAQLGEKIEEVDLIELNHFIDDEGREVFRQLVFYDWSELDKRFQVRAWRLIKNDRQLPRRFWKPTRYECHWNDDGLRKTVSAKQLCETWTQQDPERVNRKFLPENQRVPLFSID